MASMTRCSCKRCGKVFTARTADVARGWGLYCSKSCKARDQEARTGQYRALCNDSLGSSDHATGDFFADWNNQ